MGTLAERIGTWPFLWGSLLLASLAAGLSLGFTVWNVAATPESARLISLQFSDPVWRLVILRSLTLPALVAIFSGLVGTGAGFAYLNRRGIVRLLVALGLAIPLIVHPMVLTFAFLGILRQGVVADAVNRLGSFLMVHGGSWLSVAGVMTFFLYPYVGWLVLLGLQRIPQDEMRAAWNAGSSRFQLARWVLLPRARQGIYAGTILVFVQACAFFVVPVLLGDGWVNTLPVFVSDRLDLGMVDRAAAYAVVLFFVAAVCVVLSLRSLVRVWTGNV